MPSTTDDLRIKDFSERRPSEDATRGRGFGSVLRDHLDASTTSAPATSTNVYPFVTMVPDADRARREPGWIVRVWWERWLERYWFARALPWLADEVLEDYGLTREEARRLCRRPFWRA